MKITDYIRGVFQRRNNTITNQLLVNGFGDFYCTREPFADLIFYNICDLLTDICSSVTFTRKGGDTLLFAGFKVFFDKWGKFVLNQLFKEGFVPIARRKNDTRFFILPRDSYNVNSVNGETKVEPYDKDLELYVMRSQTMMLEGKSDKQMLRPFLRYLDNVLNGSNTVSERLGAAVIMSPQQASGSPMPTILTQKEKEGLEKEIGEKYGYLRNQRSVMILPNAMNVQTINLAGLDNKMLERVKTAILAICDRVKVPANQVGIIDANSSKSFANGSELREGDITKYRNFRRLLNFTFYQMAEDLGLDVDYVIENEPIERVTI